MERKMEARLPKQLLSILPRKKNFQRKNVTYTRSVTSGFLKTRRLHEDRDPGKLSPHDPTSLPPESLNKRIISDDSLSKDGGVCEDKQKQLIKNTESVCKNKQHIKNTESVYEWNRLPVDRI